MLSPTEFQQNCTSEWVGRVISGVNYRALKMMPYFSSPVAVFTRLQVDDLQGGRIRTDNFLQWNITSGYDARTQGVVTAHSIVYDFSEYVC